MQFRAELESSGTNTTGFEVPQSVVEQLGGGQRPKVTVTINGYEFRTSIARMGGRFLLGVSAERRATAGVAAGDILDVDVTLDTAVREVEVPDDFARALDQDADAKAFWDTLSYSNKQWHALQITGAKKEETRARRVEKSIATLRDGRAR